MRQCCVECFPGTKFNVFQAGVSNLVASLDLEIARGKGKESNWWLTLFLLEKSHYSNRQSSRQCSLIVGVMTTSDAHGRGYAHESQRVTAKYALVVLRLDGRIVLVMRTSSDGWA